MREQVCMSKNIVVFISASVLLGGCAINQNVSPVEQFSGKQVCVIENQSVRAGFIEAYKSALSAKGYDVRQLPPSASLTDCPITSTYNANWRWDLYAPEAGGGTYALFSMVDQVTRLILLGSATLLAMLLVGRAQKLQTAASSDPLTGVGNRVHFDRRVHAELERAMRYRRPLSLALVDVDHFKKFNDVHGHLVGDDILVTVAMLLGRSLRRSDTLARYGGEEFALVLPEAAAESALVKVDKIRQSIDATTLELPDPREPSKLTISGGIATYPEDGDTVELLLAAADDRLLAAKRAGRNQVIGGAGSVVST